MRVAFGFAPIFNHANHSVEFIAKKTSDWITSRSFVDFKFVQRESVAKRIAAERIAARVAATERVGCGCGIAAEWVPGI